MGSHQDPEHTEWLQAAERGDTAAVIKFLESGMDVDAGDSINCTALMRAVRGGHVELIRVLLDHGASLSPRNTLGNTALTDAVLRSRSWDGCWENRQLDPRPLEILLAAGARYELREAVMLNDVRLARARLAEGADPDEGEGTYDGPLLKIAAELGFLAVVDLLLKSGANVEATDDLGQRPLLSAAGLGRSEVVLRLLEHGAEINATDWSGQTALSNAAVEGHDDLYDLLLSRGAERGIVDALARNDVDLFKAFLDEELRDERDIDCLSDGRGRLATLAAAKGHAAIVRLLLDRGAAHFHKVLDDRTLLAEAAKNGHVNVVRLLIDRGADLHAVGGDGLTPRAWAVREGRDEVVGILDRAGAV